jgi:glycosyltransferase involved in cell wall biosynthesis
MHIVFVTNELATISNSAGGLASFTANMARIFYKHGHEVSIVLETTKDEHLQFEPEINLVSNYVELNNWKRMDKLAGILKYVCKDSRDEIRKFLLNIYKSKHIKHAIDEINKQSKIDIIHYCSGGADALRARKNIPYCIRLSSFSIMCKWANQPNGELNFDGQRTLKEKLTDYVVCRSKYVISPSNLVAQFAKDYYDLKVTVLESPYIMENQQWNYGKYNSLDMKDKKYILYFGTLKYLKGIMVIADLIFDLLERYPEIYMVLAGNSYNVFDEYGNPIKAHELIINRAGKYSNRVIYTGGLPREQLYPFIQNAELCLLPSRIENLSNACIEAMAMGKIVVATNGASYEQLIEDGVSGFLCERDNPDSFLKGIDRALGMSENEKINMSKNAVEVTNRLSPDNIYERYLEYYQRVIRDWNK